MVDDRLFLLAGTLGKLWRKHRRILPPEIRNSYAQLLLDFRVSFLPSENDDLKPQIERSRYDIRGITDLFQIVAERQHDEPVARRKLCLAKMLPCSAPDRTAGPLVIKNTFYEAHVPWTFCARAQSAPPALCWSRPSGTSPTHFDIGDDDDDDGIVFGVTEDEVIQSSEGGYMAHDLLCSMAHHVFHVSAAFARIDALQELMRQDGLLAEASFDIGSFMVKEMTVDDEVMDMAAIAQAQHLLGRLHRLRCNTSFESFSKEGHKDHPDDWSRSRHLLATAVIDDESHVFLLECACNATVDMVCSLVHNFIVAHIHRFLFELLIKGIDENASISELGEDPIEFRVTPLVSHNGCLHPEGEPCCCSDFLSSESEGDAEE